MAISLDDVLAAEKRLDGVVNLTPVFSSRRLNDIVGCEIVLKCESFQRTGAFKFRGAYNAISSLPPERRAAGVVAYSSGNHAQGVALSAKLLGIPAVICMPTDAPDVKRQATLDYGAEIVDFDRQTVDTDEVQARVARERGMTVIHPYDLPGIMAGQGTAALELLRQAPGLDTLIAPVGGGGLLAGCAVAAKGIDPSIRVFGVETVGADDTKLSLAAGERVSIPPPTTIADGIRLVTPGELTFPILLEHLEDVLVVSDDDVLDALRFVLLRMKLVFEPSGAVALAAAMTGLVPANCRRVGIVVSGGNIDPALLRTLW
ncbi:MAG TPA: threonine/serine dehydratase [Thermomicrobiales bacterium]|nr:threonine/serine dehydratase [Thermomicrobiales bacterium]